MKICGAIFVYVKPTALKVDRNQPSFWVIFKLIPVVFISYKLWHIIRPPLVDI
jgi:hypothetical protein